MTTIQGKLVQIAQGNGLYMLSVDTEQAADGLLELPVTAEHYHVLFPAGDPVLNEIYEFMMQPADQQMTLVNVFPVDAEVIPADLVPTLTATQNMELQGEHFMDTQKASAALEKRLDAIRQDDSLMQDIQTELDQEAQQRLANIKARQQGQGIEQLFTAEELAQLQQKQQQQPTKTVSLSEQTRVAGQDDDLLLGGDDDA
ncbi:hypothetical protein [Weissella hellenica]|uniref:Uncharacterized protein n=1 Tax=Weissella hellenica TaxID=46256 RepID=A0A4Y4FYH6_WEIHE|nr:hypothetical protein [Weissella hellenica]NKY66600.1 hypothetical protein [Weissella hellenica]GED35212.1 hypothetical protein WHE01_01160 [Weissella hellenica]SCB81269.1 hypothetical protein GA0061075_10317 [Weissella hellenica]